METEPSNYEILYLEDENFFFNIVKMYAVENYSFFKITNAPDVSSAKELFKHNKYAAIICDYYLPEGETGIDFLKFVRLRSVTVPVVFLTGVDSKDVAIEALNNGADFYIEKSNLITGDENNFHTLFQELEKLIKRKSRNNPIYHEKDIRKKIDMAFDITDHDIKNCLTVIELATDCIQDDYETLEKSHVRDSLRNIMSSVGVIKESLKSFCEYKQLENDAFDWHSVEDIVKRVSKQFGSRLEVRSMVKTGLSINTSRFIDKVFYNLFDNAIRHGNAKKISCYSSFEEGNLILTIIDDGVGVKEGFEELIFRRGYGNNTGYGLFFCAEVLSMTGISIKESGTEGEGARFELVVPQGTYKID
ncbi:MAG: Sensor histidine kinase MtrB [Parcubacteria group bacterium ADurb.Bin216]|nr:MAG: Sensor histidine kinase MtrB [Parcubacteria group bacterium ADurb.Bin216]